MRTTLNLADDVIEELMKITKERTKTKAINEALKDYIRQKRLERFKSLSGKITIEDNWRQLREMELDEK